MLAGTIPSDPFAGVAVKAIALHTDLVIAVTAGTGLTVTDLVIGVPGHAVAPGPVGVIVYVTTTAAL